RKLNVCGWRELRFWLQSGVKSANGCRPIFQSILVRASSIGERYGLLQNDRSTRGHRRATVLVFLEQQALVAHTDPDHAGDFRRAADPGPELCDRAVYLLVLLRKNVQCCFTL